MELALYCPLCGYYEKKTDTPGRRGDYYTSVSVGPLFGQLLAFQFARWLEPLAAAAGGPMQILEAGAHDGRLARDILEWFRSRRPDLLARLEYRIAEPSATRRAWQADTLGPFAQHVRWDETCSDTAADADATGGDVEPQEPVCGIIFCNELLDAFPVHRLGWDARRRQWFEWGVTWAEGRYAWTRLEEARADALVAESFGNLSPELLAVLPDGFTTEVSPAALRWWRQAAARLRRGKLLALDYGLEAAELLRPERREGTLRAYRGHRLVGDPLANPGEQDLTAHVNFTAVRWAGEQAGLRTEAYLSQAQFLTSIARQAWESGSAFGPWTAAQTRQFQTLTHPEHLGRAFRVLIQCRE